MDRRLFLAAGLALAASPALALDPGTASGSYLHHDVTLKFDHAVALILDNAEGFRDHPTTLRLLVADREPPASDLMGLAFPPIWAKGKAGEIHGLLIELDPADPTSLTATILLPPEEEGYSLTTLSLSHSEGLWERLEVGDTRVTGKLKADAVDDFTLEFSAPLFTDKVTADLKGAAAQSSEPVQVLMARAQALSRGDMAAAAALSTAEAAKHAQDLPPEFLKQAKAMTAQMIKDLKAAKRVVIREQTAAVMLGPGEWSSLVREGGTWKAD